MTTTTPPTPPPAAYSGTAKAFHWVMGVIIIIMLIFGWTMEDMPAAEREFTLRIHTGLGLTILTLAIFRLLWRRAHPPPPYPHTMPAWQQRAAHGVARAFYVLMIYQPTVGLLHAATYAEFPIFAFGLVPLSGVLPADAQITQVFHVLHGLGALVFSVLLLVHVGAAFRHLLLERDGVFRRMWPL